MRVRTTIALAVVNLLLFAYIHFFESTRDTTEERGERILYVLNFDPGATGLIRIVRGEEVLEFRKDPGSGLWFMKEPLVDRLNQALVEELLTQATLLRIRGRIAPNEIKQTGLNMKKTGLDEGIRLVLKDGNGDPQGAVTVGGASQISNTVYMLQQESGDVCVATAHFKTLLEQERDAFRDPALLAVDPSQVLKLSIKGIRGEIEVARASERHPWKLLKPLHARTDAHAIGDLLARVFAARIVDFIEADDSATPATHGFGNGHASLTLWTLANPDGTLVEIGNPVTDAAGRPNGAVYVRVSGRDRVFKVPDSLATLLDITPDALRDRKLTRINPKTVTDVRVQSPRNPDILLQRTRTGWLMKNRGESQPANETRVVRLIAALNEEDIKDFTANTTADLAAYGLEKPEVTIDLILQALVADNTARATPRAGVPEGTRLISSNRTLYLGRPDETSLFAYVEDEPFIYQLEPSFLASIPLDPIEYRGLRVLTLSPDRFHSLQVTRNGDAAEKCLFSTENKVWTLESAQEGREINPVGIEALTRSLSAMASVKWLTSGRKDAYEALRTPTLKIAFSYLPASKLGLEPVPVDYEFIFAPTTREGRAPFYFAQRTGNPDIFLLDAAAYDGLCVAIARDEGKDDAEPGDAKPAGTPSE